MDKEVIKRVEAVSDHIIKTKNTIRKTAEKFGVSKSTIHKDIQERLKEIDIKKYYLIENIFNDHIRVRHILGGESTKLKYQQLKSKG